MTNKTEPTVFDLLKAGKTVECRGTHYRLSDTDVMLYRPEKSKDSWLEVHPDFWFFMNSTFTEVKEPLTEEELVLALVRDEDVVDDDGDLVVFNEFPFTCKYNDCEAPRSFKDLNGTAFRK